MKVAIFENEYSSVKGGFETANLVEFNGTLEIINFTSSQKADLNRMNEFNVIFVDIDLSTNSDLDGFTLIKKLVDVDKDIIKRIIILTGNNKIREALETRNMDANDFKVIIKPTDYEEIAKNIKSVVTK